MAAGWVIAGNLAPWLRDLLLMPFFEHVEWHFGQDYVVLYTDATPSNVAR